MSDATKANRVLIDAIRDVLGLAPIGGDPPPSPLRFVREHQDPDAITHASCNRRQR